MPKESAPLTPSPAPPETGNGFRSWHSAPSTFGRVNWLLAEYRPVVYLAIASLFFLGLRVTGPGARLNEVESRMSEHADRITGQMARQDSVIRILTSAVEIQSRATARLERLQCFNAAYTDRELDLADFTICRDLRRQRDLGR